MTSLAPDNEQSEAFKYNYWSTIFTVKRNTGFLKITISPTNGGGWLKPRKKEPSFH